MHKTHFDIFLIVLVLSSSTRIFWHMLWGEHQQWVGEGRDQILWLFLWAQQDPWSRDISEALLSPGFPRAQTNLFFPTKTDVSKPEKLTRGSSELPRNPGLDSWGVPTSTTRATQRCDWRTFVVSAVEEPQSVSLFHDAFVKGRLCVLKNLSHRALHTAHSKTVSRSGLGTILAAFFTWNQEDWPRTSSAPKRLLQLFWSFLWALETGTVEVRELGGWNWEEQRAGRPREATSRTNWGMEKEWGGSSGMYGVVASLNDAAPEKGEYLWVSGPAVLMLARLALGPPWCPRHQHG